MNSNVSYVWVELPFTEDIMTIEMSTDIEKSIYWASLWSQS